MKCKVCGAKIRDGAEFCENCGMKVADGVPYTPSINNRPQRPYKKPWYRKWWIWTILGLLTAVIVCAVLSFPLLILAQNYHPKDYYSYTLPNVTVPNITVPDVTAPYAAVPDSTAPSSSVQQNSVYNAGETCNADGLKITLEKSEDYDNKEDFIQPEAGKKFIRIYFNIKNETGEDQYIGSYGFSCYADGFKCKENIMGVDLDNSYGSISNGRSTKLCLCYEVPVNAESIEVEYDSSYSLPSKKYTFKVK